MGKFSVEYLDLLQVSKLVGYLDLAVDSGSAPDLDDEVYAGAYISPYGCRYRYDAYLSSYVFTK